MKASIIITSYNFENYIEQTILSAIAQKTNFDFEILIRDDFSSDNSVEKIKRVIDCNENENIRFFPATSNWGQNKNLKFLFEQSKGEYISHLDGDDFFLNLNKLQKQVDFLEQNKDYVLTFCGFWNRYENNIYEPNSPNHWLSIHPKFGNREIITEDFLNGNSVTFGKVFRNIPNLFKDWMMDLPFWDWMINYELSKHGKIKYLDFPCGVYRNFKDNTINSFNTEQRISIDNEIKKRIKEDYLTYYGKEFTKL
jgi:glycosyltransferase involved in cell wall biosynthesis